MPAIGYPYCEVRDGTENQVSARKSHSLQCARMLLLDCEHVVVLFLNVGGLILSAAAPTRNLSTLAFPCATGTSKSIL